MLPSVVRNKQRFQSHYSNIFQFWPYNRFLCSQSLHDILRNKKEFPKLMKCPWVRNKYIPNEQGFIFFLINGEHFPLLLETNNAFRIFMVLLETKSAIVIKNSVQLPIYSLKFWSFSYLFLQVTWLFFFSGDITKISGNMTLGEMTLRQLDQLPRQPPNKLADWQLTVTQLEQLFTLP